MSQVAPRPVLATAGKLASLASAILITMSVSGLAASPNVPTPGEPPHRSAQHRDQVGVSSPASAAVAASSNARLAAVIRQGGSIIRSKGVQSVTNPFFGTYCVRPTAASGVNPRTIVPVITVDYDRSTFNEVMAQYSDVGPDCPLGTIEVLTFDDRNLDAIYFDSNSVGFTIVVN